MGAAGIAVPRGGKGVSFYHSWSLLGTDLPALTAQYPTSYTHQDVSLCPGRNDRLCVAKAKHALEE